MKYIIDKSKAKSINTAENPSTYEPATYVSSLINKVNEWAWATRPVTVGELATEIFPEFISFQASTPYRHRQAVQGYCWSSRHRRLHW